MNVAELMHILAHMERRTGGTAIVRGHAGVMAISLRKKVGGEIIDSSHFLKPIEIKLLTVSRMQQIADIMVRSIISQS